MLEVAILLLCSLPAVCSVGEDEDPASWPGHLEPLGAGAELIQIESLDYFPSPQEFFMKFAYFGVPVIFRGGAKSYPAFAKWSDLYLKGLPDARWHLVDVEINKKEKRSLPSRSMPFQEFINRYRSRNEYLVTSLPSFLRRDVLLPPPLLCNSVTSHLVNSLLWISGGGTKSVLHNDNVDNINCIFSGRKEFLLLNYTRYKNDVIFDQIEDGAMSVDVDKVDFVRYPSLAKVDFHFGNLSAGDCIFLPYKWIHQVNSFDRNIAVNVWWDHKARIVPTEDACGFQKKGTTLDEVFFQQGGLYRHDDDGAVTHRVTDESDPVTDLIALFEDSDARSLSVEEFTNLALEVSQWSHLNRTKEVVEEFRKLYLLFDEDGDGTVTMEDAVLFRSEDNVHLHDLAQTQAEVLLDLLDQQIIEEKQDQLRELRRSMDGKRGAEMKNPTSDVRTITASHPLESRSDGVGTATKDEL